MNRAYNEKNERQVSKLRKLHDSAGYVIEEQLKKIDESFCPLCENAHKPLIPIASSNHQ